MSGPSSGNRWRYGAKRMTDFYPKVDVRLWAREGVLTPGYSGTRCWQRNGEIVHVIHVRTEFDQVVLSYSHRNGEWQDEQGPVRIVRTLCHFGGSRPWFICPEPDCGRHVAILYGGSVFVCRHCYQLAYPSTRESPRYRATRRAAKLRARLGWEPGILNGGGPKPKWMRWHTFENLAREHDELVKRALWEMVLEPR